MAAKFSFVESIEVEYQSDRSSIGVLIVTFTGHGDQPTRPALGVVPNPPDIGWPGQPVAS
jgi:hypothetical protein